MEIFTGFLIGIFGSFHCIGMCGPIALALPTESKNAFRIINERALYNVGRIVTYSAAGALFGLFGRGLALVGVQQIVSIILGIIILAAVLLPQKLTNQVIALKPIAKLTNSLKKLFGRLMRSNSTSSFFIMGLLNGLLPCGLVYVAIAGAVSIGGALNGAIFMALFGLGTFPSMFAFSILGKFLSTKLKRKFNKLVPVFAIIIALLFILRGLNLGIPFVSPKLDKPMKSMEHMQH